VDTGQLLLNAGPGGRRKHEYGDLSAIEVMLAAQVLVSGDKQLIAVTLGGAKQRPVGKI
jgi:hypothetical protein